MKIPSYQMQVNFQRPTAQTVQLAVPTLPSSREAKWSKLADTGNALLRVKEGYQSVKKFLDGFTYHQKTEKAAPGSSVRQQSYEGFSSSARGNLLEFSRAHALTAEHNDNTSPAASATEQLDTYFLEQAREHAADLTADNPDAHLLVQDYVVLRQELQDIESKQAAQKRQEQFNQGVNHFVQVAGLIRNPAAMQQYVQNNLVAAAQESKALGQSEQVWQRQKQNLYNAALQHNIQSALKAGEISQARGMYQHFCNTLAPSEQELLQRNLMRAEAQAYASQAGAEAYAQCVSQEREIQEEKLQQFASRHASQTGMPAELLQESLQVELSQQIRRQYLQQAQVCRQLLQDSALSVDTIVGQEPQREWAEKLGRALQTEYGFSSEPAVYNALYELSGKGEILPADVMNAYDDKRISAADALRLTEHCCRVQAGQTDAREALLAGAVEQFCLQRKLSQEQLEQARYFVFSAGCDTQAHLAAAQTLKQIFTLQEK